MQILKYAAKGYIFVKIIFLLLHFSTTETLVATCLAVFAARNEAIGSIGSCFTACIESGSWIDHRRVRKYYFAYDQVQFWILILSDPYFVIWHKSKFFIIFDLIKNEFCDEFSYTSSEVIFILFYMSFTSFWNGTNTKKKTKNFRVVLTSPKSIQATVTLLENLHVILEKTPREDVRSEILPLLFNSFESNTIQVQVRKLLLCI